MRSRQAMTQSAATIAPTKAQEPVERSRFECVVDDLQALHEPEEFVRRPALKLVEEKPAALAGFFLCLLLVSGDDGENVNEPELAAPL